MACAMEALMIIKAVFKHLPAQVAPATLKLGCNAWMLAPHGVALTCPFCKSPKEIMLPHLLVCDVDLLVLEPGSPARFRARRD